MRKIAEPFVVAAPSGVRIRTRLHPTITEASALVRVGEHLGRLYRSDVAGRVALGRVPDKERGRTKRKRVITADSSSRWAGSITRAAEDQYQLSLRSLVAEAAHLYTATEALDRRLAVPAGEKLGRVRGYKNAAEHYQKTRRRAQLGDRLAGVQKVLEAGTPSIAIGGGRLWKSRNNLAATGLTREQWEQRWAGSRLFLTADGESGQIGGNQTIRVSADGLLSLKVPAPLVPVLGQRLVIDEPVAFNHRGGEWADRATGRRSIRYDISYKPSSDRWYLDASWSYGTIPVPGLAAVQAGEVVGVDLNADHLAAARLDASGNPVGTPITIPLDLAGKSAGTRDGRLRAAITTLLDFARNTCAHAVAVENLNFQDARSTGRENMGRGKRGKTFRRTVAGIPTGKFRDRLAAMAANRGIHVIAVDPAYTSMWGGQHWQKPLQASDATLTRHHAASVAIGRRALGHGIRRRDDGPRTRQRTRTGQPSLRPNPQPENAANPTGQARQVTTSHPCPPGTSRRQPPKTVRGARTPP